MTRDFENTVSEVSRVTQEYTYPIVKLDEKSLPDLVASCIFLRINSSIYLTTAAHVIRSSKIKLYTRGNAKLVNVSGHTTISRSEGTDHFDIAAMKVDDAFVNDNGIKIVPHTMYVTNTEVSNPHSRAICGYPVSMNKQIKSVDQETNTFTAKIYTYLGFAEFDGNYAEFNKSPDTHIGIEFIHGKDDRGRFMSTPPSPRGMSGGGAWLVPDLSKPNLVFLEGTFIEAHKRSKMMYGFSTKIEHVINFIKNTHS